MKLNILIPNYNGKHLLEKNLPAILSLIPGVQIILVDDFSSDGSADFVGSRFPEVKIIRRIKNGGFSTSVNEGVRECGDYFMLLNTDVVPISDFLSRALSHFEDSNVFAVGFLQRITENGKTDEAGAGKGFFRKGFLYHAPSDPKMPYTLWVSGGAGLFSRKVWEKLGGLEEKYNPFYWEDIDLSYRALKSGHRIIFDSSCVVQHDHATGTISSSFAKERVKEIAYRNQIYFTWMNITDQKYFTSHLGYLPFHIMRAVIRRDWPFLKGFSAALRNLKAIKKIRKSRKKLWRHRDGDII